MKRLSFLIGLLAVMMTVSACAAFGLVSTGPSEFDILSSQISSTNEAVSIQIAATSLVGGNTMNAVGGAGATGLNAPVPVQGQTAADGTLSNMVVQPVLGGEESEIDEPATEGTFENYGVNPFETANEDNLSTFAMDVDTASYTLARGYLIGYNQLPPADAVRIEEFINYLPTRYAPPTDGSAFAIHLDAAPSPFVADGNLLLRVGIQGRVIAPQDRDPATLIFVIDVSGSMDSPERLGMVKETLNLLVPQLREDDQVGIVIYANEARLVLAPTPASEQQTILNAIDSLISEGSTYAEAGLMLGYNVARQHLRQDGTTRVILLSDGVANVGETGPDQILQTIQQGVEDGVTLSTIGFGMGSFNDVLMEQLANDGNGNYFYVDNLREARRVFVNNLTSTLQVIGYDAKIQVEFNADVVSEYRLLGYENRAIADADFRNDTVDAGEVGAGHSITALYEVVLKDGAQGDIAKAQIRYEDAESRAVIEQNATVVTDDVVASFSDMSVDFRLHAAVAELAELLRGSEYAADGSYAAVLAVVQPMGANEIYAAEIAQMAQLADQLSQ
jgi:Ca-activated chloride channel homolog